MKKITYILIMHLKTPKYVLYIALKIENIQNKIKSKTFFIIFKKKF